jgi:hypothetical protein
MTFLKSVDGYISSDKINNDDVRELNVFAVRNKLNSFRHRV